MNFIKKLSEELFLEQASPSQKEVDEFLSDLKMVGNLYKNSKEKDAQQKAAEIKNKHSSTITKMNDDVQSKILDLLNSIESNKMPDIVRLNKSINNIASGIDKISNEIKNNPNQMLFNVKIHIEDFLDVFNYNKQNNVLDLSRIRSFTKSIKDYINDYKKAGGDEKIAENYENLAYKIIKIIENKKNIKEIEDDEIKKIKNYIQTAIKIMDANDGVLKRKIDGKRSLPPGGDERIEELKRRLKDVKDLKGNNTFDTSGRKAVLKKDLNNITVYEAIQIRKAFGEDINDSEPFKDRIRQLAGPDGGVLEKIAEKSSKIKDITYSKALDIVENNLLGKYDEYEMEAILKIYGANLNVDLEVDFDPDLIQRAKKSGMSDDEINSYSLTSEEEFEDIVKQRESS